MRVIDINLATRPFRNNTFYWAGFGSAAAALAALSLVNLWLFFGYGSTMRLHQEEFTTKQGRRDLLARQEKQLSVKLTKLDFKGLSQQAGFANDAIRRRIFSWTELFNRLEEVVPPTVMMASIRPEIQAEGISIIVEGVAKDQEGILDFEENLIRDRFFARIYPGSERREQRDRDLRFSLKFDYVPAGRPEAEGASAGGDLEKPKEGPPKEGPLARSPEEVPASAPTPDPTEPRPSPPAPSLPPPPAAPPTGIQAAGSGTPAPPPSSPVAAPGTTGGAAPKTPAALAGATRRGGPGGRPLLRPGGGVRGGPIGPGAGPPGRGPAAQRRAQEEAAARFVNVPLQDILDYLTKQRGMTFIFAGDFDLRQKASMDLNNKEDEDVLLALAQLLDCVIAREPAGVYRLSPKSGGEPLEEPPVEEEPVPETPQEPPPQEPPP